MEPGRGGLRALRGGLLAVSCSLLGISAHLLGGGSLALGPTLLAALLAALGAVGLAGRRRGARTLFLAAAVVQAGFHVALSGGHDMAAHAAPDGSLPGLWMTAAHAVGTVLVAVVLARGDAALFAMGRLAGRWRAGRVSPPLMPAPVVAASVRPSVPRRPLALFLTAQLRYRGPPVDALA